MEGWNSGKNLLPSWAWQDEGPPWPPRLLLLLGHHGGHHGDHRTICPWERDLPPHSGLLFLNQFPCLQGSLRPFGAWPKIVGRG